MASGEDGPALRLRRSIYAAAAILGLSSLVGLRVCDDILKALHPAGDLSYGMASLSDLGFHIPSLAAPRDAVLTWREASAASAGLTGFLWLVAIYLLVDLGFIVAYGTLFAVLLRRGYLGLAAKRLATPVQAAQRNLVRRAFYLVPLVVLADLVENLATALLVPELAAKSWFFLPPDSWSFPILVGAAILKWVLVVGVLGALAIVASIFLLDRFESRVPTSQADRKRTLAQALTTLATLRVQVVLVLVFALFLLGPTAKEQVADVMRRWSFSADASEGFFAIVFTTWLFAVTYALSGRLLNFTGGAREDIKVRRIAVAGIVLTILGAVLLATTERFEGVLVLGVITLAIAGLSAAVGTISSSRADDPKASGAGTSRLPPLLAALPLVILGIAVLDASLTELIYSGTLSFLVLVAVGLGLQVVGWLMYVWVRARWDERVTESQPPHGSGPVLWTSVVLVVAFSGLVFWRPWDVGEIVGFVGVLAVFAIAVSVVGYAALRLEQKYRPPACFRVLGLKRIPIFALAIVAFLATSRADKGGFHDVRTIAYVGKGGSPRHQLFYVQAWNRWRDAQGLVPGRQTTESAEEVRVVPLVFVAAEGGGIRATVWTARVLDCIYAKAPADCGGAAPNPHAGTTPPPFVESGVSGGSLGLVEYLAHELGSVDDEDDDWVERRTGGDQLAATWAWTLFVDLPNALLRVDPDRDRAAVLEEAWERAWDGKTRGDPQNPMRKGFFAVSTRDEQIPLLLLNGTSVQDGCRVNTSLIDGDIDSVGASREERLRDCLTLRGYEQGTSKPADQRANWVFGATQDLGELLCGKDDVRLSTAALLSARFPFVTPSARVTHCSNKELATFVVDGGYFDTSASSPIVELWTRVEPLVSSFNRSTTTQCVVPLMLQIDNHYTEPRGIAKTRRSPELFVPIEAVKAARNARETDARQTAALTFDGRFGPHARITLDGNEVDRYAHVYPRAHPGTTAPLGWALSDASMKDLTDQLGGSANKAELAKVASWFDPRLRCEPAGP